MGGLAARVAGERYLGWDIDRAKHASDLRQALGGLKGPIMKVAQILSAYLMPCQQNMQRNSQVYKLTHLRWVGYLPAASGQRAWH